MNLSTKLVEVKGVGQATAGLFLRLGIVTVEDLINHYPRRYEDYSKITDISKAAPGNITIKAKLEKITSRYGKRRGLHITECLATDNTGSLKVVWFNQSYRAKSIQPGKLYYLSGSFDFSGGYLSLMNPSIEIASTFTVNTARILPVYPETKGLTSLKIRKVLAEIKGMFTELSEPLPTAIIKKSSYDAYADSLLKLHFPKSSEDITAAKTGLAFRELFVLSLASQLLKKDMQTYRSRKIPINEQKIVEYVSSLPFQLTAKQKKIVWRILKDMSENNHPMNRLVEGDVGSGKTVIASIAALNVALFGGQTALMAPTELLATQHYRALIELFKDYLDPEEILFLSSSQKTAEKQKAHKYIASGKAKILIGTHALFQKHIETKNLELIIIDEQHRFGVAQREALLGKAQKIPHVLTMTATPIPRSLALVLYGEMSLSILDEKPPGRKEVSTELVSLNLRLDVFKQIIAKAEPSQQAYIVCPSIDSTEQADSIEDTERFLKKHFPDLKYGVVHGRMKQDEKDVVMADFIAGAFNVLLATTVIEVGVNVLTASTIGILSPERFGLAQLHQLRGRVGRSNQPGKCFLFLQDNQKPSRRLQMISQINDGFKLADIDLEMRGPGALYGVRQSGALDLRMADFSNPKLLKQARDLAEQFVESGDDLLQYPQLHKTVIAVQKVTNLN